MVDDNIVITNIFWKRTYLFIEYNANKKYDIFLKEYHKKSKAEIFYMQTKKISEGQYRAKINIAVAKKREILLPGKWEIKSTEKIILSKSILENIESYCRVFRYNEINAYIATFEITDKTPINLLLYTSYMQTNKKYKKILVKEVIKQGNLKDKTRKILVILFKKILNFFYKIMAIIIPKKGKNILFLSQNMDHIRDNMKAVKIRIYERKIDKNFNIKEDFTNLFDGKKRYFYWLKIIIKLASSDYIFVDDYIPVLSFLSINKKTKVIQLWHAGFGFKLVGYGRFGLKGSPHPYESCHRKYTYGIIGNENLKEIYSEVWGIEKDCLLATGMPRLEHFLDEGAIDKARAKLRKEYPQIVNKKVITFAPTYRGYNQQEAYYDYDSIDFDKLYNYCQESNSIVIFKMHHFINQKINIDKKYKNIFYDLSNYNLNDLLYSTDILITDYSSCFYDFLLLKKTIIFYVYDKDIYCSTRGIHRPLEDVAPGKICTNFDELLGVLRNKNYKNQNKKEFLVDKCLTNKKIASDQIIDYILLEKGVKKNEV